MSFQQITYNLVINDTSPSFFYIKYSDLSIMPQKLLKLKLMLIFQRWRGGGAKLKFFSLTTQYFMQHISSYEIKGWGGEMSN